MCTYMYARSIFFLTSAPFLFKKLSVFVLILSTNEILCFGQPDPTCRTGRPLTFVSVFFVVDLQNPKNTYFSYGREAHLIGNITCVFVWKKDCEFQFGA